MCRCGPAVVEVVLPALDHLAEVLVLESGRVVPVGLLDAPVLVRAGPEGEADRLLVVVDLVDPVRHLRVEDGGALDHGRDLEREADLPRGRAPDGGQRLRLRRAARSAAASAGSGRRGVGVSLPEKVWPTTTVSIAPLARIRSSLFRGMALDVGRVEQPRDRLSRELRLLLALVEDLRPERPAQRPGAFAWKPSGGWPRGSPSGSAGSSCSPRPRAGRSRSGRRGTRPSGSARPSSSSCAGRAAPGRSPSRTPRRRDATNSSTAVSMFGRGRS